MNKNIVLVVRIRNTNIVLVVRWNTNIVLIVRWNTNQYCTSCQEYEYCTSCQEHEYCALDVARMKLNILLFWNINKFLLRWLHKIYECA